MANEQSRYLTTSQAALYCNYEDGSSLRKALKRGKIRSIGRRGGNGTHMWDRAELDRFLAGKAGGSVDSRSGTPLEREEPENEDANTRLEVALGTLDDAVPISQRVQ